MVAFQQIPVDLRVPGVFLEVDPSLAEQGIGSFPLRALIIAQKTSAGSLAVNTPERITSAEQASALAGPGSLGSRLPAGWYMGNRSTELDLVLQDDDGGGTANARTLTFGGAPAAGVLAVYVDGDRYQISTAGTLVATAALLESTINANGESSVVAAVNPGQLEEVILTSKNAGEVGNSGDVRVAHLDGETIPSGLTVAVVNPSSGVGNPDITAALAAVAGVHYDIIVHAYTDASNLGILEAELLARAAAMSAIPGQAFTGFGGSQGLLAAMGDSRNSPHSTIVGFETFPGVPAERAAQIAGLVAFHGAIDPGRPFQTLRVEGFAPSVEDRFSQSERNLLLFDGVSTVKADRVGTVSIERLITTFQTNAAGAPSTAFLDVNLMLLLSFYRKSFAAWMLSRFPRHKLAADGGSPPGPGTAVATPKVFEAESVSHYQSLIELGLVEDIDGFIANSTYGIAPSDPNRIDAGLAPNFINQFRANANLVQFRL